MLERQCLPQSECDDEKFHQPLPTAAVCLRFPLLLESRSSGRNCGGPSPKSKPSARGARNPSGTQRLIVQYYSTKASVQRSHPQQIESHQRPNTKRHTGSFMVALDLVQQRLNVSFPWYCIFPNRCAHRREQSVRRFDSLYRSRTRTVILLRTVLGIYVRTWYCTVYSQSYKTTSCRILNLLSYTTKPLTAVSFVAPMIRIFVRYVL